MDFTFKKLRRLPGSDYLRFVREYLNAYRRVEMPNDYFQFFGSNLYSSGRFEKDITSYLKIRLKPERTFFIDIGAHHGYFSCLASSLGCPVRAYEPDFLNRRILIKNRNVNEFQQLEISGKAMGEYLKEFETMHGFGTGVSFNSDWSGSSSSRKFSAPVSTLDIETKEMAASDYVVKMDVEGAEKNVLLGSTNFLSRQTSISLIIEITSAPSDYDRDYRVTKDKSVFGILREFGFFPYSVGRDGSLHSLKERDFAEEVHNRESPLSANFVFNRS